MSPLLYGTALVPDSKGGGVALFKVGLAKAAVIYMRLLSISRCLQSQSQSQHQHHDLVRKADSRNNAS
jgi:hypothetical protein